VLFPFPAPVGRPLETSLRPPTTVVYQCLEFSLGSVSAFELPEMQEQGQTSRQSGIYGCTLCGAAVYVPVATPFPSCGSDDHTAKWVLEFVPMAVKSEAIRLNRERPRHPVSGALENAIIGF